MGKYTVKILYGIKVIAAAVLSTLTALALGLEFAVSAGIVAILSVQATKKETLKTALSRFLAFIAAIGISYVSYKVFGFTFKAFFVYLAVFIPVCLVFDWNSAMAMDSVLISHFISFGAMGPSEIRNESFLFVIGVGFGIFVNIFLKKNTDIIERLKSDTDELIRLLLHRMGLRIMDKNLEGFDGTCFTKLDKAIFEAKKQAEINFKNQFGKKDTYDIRYLDMREQQVQLLKEMYKSLCAIDDVPVTAEVIAIFFEKVSAEYHRDNDVLSLLEELAEIRSSMKTQPLPVERREFENRANLFVLLGLLEEFLELKSAFMRTR